MSRDAISTFREAALQERLIGIVKSPDAQKIECFLGYLLTSGLGHLRVADALRRDSTKISTGTVPEDAADPYCCTSRCIPKWNNSLFAYGP
jgi:hypothetical protein